MSTAFSSSPLQIDVPLVQRYVELTITKLLGSLPDPERLDSEQRRGIIARYTAVLEGNFIYWMTGAYLSVESEQARSIIRDNLLEEVRDSHPRMLRKFALAARAFPTDSDALAVHRELTSVRLFVGRLSGVSILVTMAFFEGFIQRFMAYLADLAAKQGSTEFEYTDVHGTCDVQHTMELYHALEAEMAAGGQEEATDLFEGVELLRTLIRTVVDPAMASGAVHRIAPDDWHADSVSA
jgi:hypothetical protein